MTLKRALMVLVLTALAALAACGDQRGHTEIDRVADPGLGPITYVVTGVTENGTPHALVDGTQVRIRIADGKVTLTAGCNTMSAAYQLEETRLTVEPLTTTEMGCDRPRMDQDTWLAGLFEKPVQLTTGGEPTIVSGTTVLALTDREIVSPDLPLTGTWELDSIATMSGDAGSVLSMPNAHPARLTVRADGTFTATWGCGSSVGGRYEVTGSTATWTVSSNGIADCTSEIPGAADAEDALTTMLDGSTSVRTEEKNLHIEKGSTRLGFHASTGQ